MSVVLYRNCPTCGQPFEIHEETHNRVFLMGGVAVQEWNCETQTVPLVVVGEKEYMDSAASHARTKLLEGENFGTYIDRRIVEVFNDLAGEAGERLSKEYGENVPAGALAFELMANSVKLQQAWGKIVDGMKDE